MRALSSLPLDDDIIDRFLTFLPCFSALGATLLASRHFYNVYKTHPNSVLRAVAYNVTGPALPQAMRVLRYTLDPVKFSLSTLSVMPWAETDSISPITDKEARKLTENAAVVAALEDLFSWRHVYFAIPFSRDINRSSVRHKDRTSQTSRLDPTESERFRCAVYRLMLISRALPLHEDEVTEDGVDTEEIYKIRLERGQFLEEFPDYELLAVHSVAVFLTELVEWAAVAGGSRSCLLFYLLPFS